MLCKHGLRPNKPCWIPVLTRLLNVQMIEEEEIEVPVSKAAEPTPMEMEGDKKEEASTAAGDADTKMDDAEAGAASEKQAEGGAAANGDAAKVSS